MNEKDLKAYIQQAKALPMLPRVIIKQLVAYIRELHRRPKTGRPRTVDHNEVRRLKAEGRGSLDIADRVGCTASNVRMILKGSK